MLYNSYRSTTGVLLFGYRSSVQAVSLSCLRKDKEKPDLLLTGSQVRIVCYYNIQFMIGE
jgi:hypothetical protein